MQQFDILFVADPRFPGGTSTGVASEIAAARRAGFQCGLLMVKGPILQRPHPIHAEIRALIDSGDLALCDPEREIAAPLVLIHHPSVFAHLPARRLRVRCEHVALVVPHPEMDAAGEVQFDLPAIVANVAAAFGREPVVAAVGVNVRRSFRLETLSRIRVMAEDWPYVLDLGQWPPRIPYRPVGSPVAIGRHARPDPAKWPDTREEALQVYPDSAEYQIRVLGGGDFLRERYGALPANWQVLPFVHGGVSEFLQGLDFYVYFHSSAWVEAFGRNVLEALATGLVTILPRSFEAQFGDAAVYATPAEVREVIARFVADPPAYRAQAARARSMVERLHAPERFAERVKAEFGLEPRRAGAMIAMRNGEPRPVLFFSSNGVGLGHLTRQFAIARRLPGTIRPIFVTMSQAFKMVLAQGYAGEFIPFHRRLEADPERWNNVLAEEVFELLNFYRPRAVVFDGNSPYPGMLDAFDTRPGLMKIWIRRAMWKPRHQHILQKSSRFDLIIEPGEIAADFDHGPTREVRAKAHQVGPILHLDPGEAMDRDCARAELGLGADRIAVCLQLGSGNNYDFSAMREEVLRVLAGYGRVSVIELRSPVSDGQQPEPAFPAHRVLETYPAAKYLSAFDFAVSAAGYNSFHENLLAGLPTIFVPNEAEEMDSQLSRARYAEVTGLGRLLRRQDMFDVPAMIAEMMDPGQRDGIRARCAALKVQNGASAAARFIADAVDFVRTDIDIGIADFRD